MVLALAEMQYLRQHDRVTVIYLLDQSESVPKVQRHAMVEYVKEAVRQHRDATKGDRAALVIFGREANVEIPPVEADLPIVSSLEKVSISISVSETSNVSRLLSLAMRDGSSATSPIPRTLRIVSDSSCSIPFNEVRK